jgi:hypothetical protein
VLEVSGRFGGVRLTEPGQGNSGPRVQGSSSEDGRPGEGRAMVLAERGSGQGWGETGQGGKRPGNGAGCQD